MHSHFRKLALVAIFSIGTGVCVAPVLAQEEHHDQHEQREQQQRAEQRNVEHPDYSNNNYYRMGNREGYQDHGRNSQRSKHNHKYRSDDDRSAHDYGYQQGWQGTDYRTAPRPERREEHHEDPR